MNAVIDKLPALVEEELAAANAKHPPFHSAHEGYAVILEEIEETAKELANAENMIRHLWSAIRHDDSIMIKKATDVLKGYAVQAAAEAIQVAAMAEKMLDFFKCE